MPMMGLGLGLGFEGVVPAAVATAKPTNTAAPSITGIQTQGQTLAGDNGSWDQPVTSFAYKWQTSADGSTGWADISGATSATYVPVAGDVGKFLRRGVLASNSFGAATAGYAFSVATGAIAAPLTISGSPATTAYIGIAYSFTPSTAGGHTPKSFAIVNKPSWAAFSTSTGQLTGTPTGAETDTGINITVTDNDGLTASLGAWTINVSSAPPLAAPYFDDFGGSSATVSGRAVPFGSPTINWTEGAEQPSPQNSIKVDGSGHAIGMQAGSYFTTTVEIDTGVTSRKWWRAEMSYNPSSAPAFNGYGSYFFVHHSVPTPNNGNSTRLQYSVGGDIIQLASGIDYDNDGGGTEWLHTNVDSAGRGVYTQAGDTFELRQKVVSGQTLIEPYYNGQQIGPDIRIDNISGLTLSGKLAIKGMLPTNGELDSVLVGDPDAHGMISVYAPRVPQINADGSVTIALNGDYSGALSSLTWTLYDAGTLTAVTGYVDQAFTSFATGAAATASSDGSWSGKCVIASGKIGSAGAYIVVKRSGLLSSGTTTTRTPVFTPGQVVLMYGQSLTSKMWQEGWAGLTFTPPANAWVIDASVDNNGDSSTFPTTAINRKTQPLSGDLCSWTNPAWAAYQYRTVLSGAPVAYIRGGRGDTYYHTRLPGGPLGIWEAAVDGISRLAGGDVAWVFDAAGEYEAAGAVDGAGYQMATFTSADQAAWIADIQAIYDALEALTGRTVKVVIRPVGAIFTGGDVRCEAARRLQWKLTQDYPSRYILGGYGMDQQHNTATDQYHLASYQEQIRRLVFSMAKAQGLSSFDRTGPKLFSVTAWSATSVTVRFDKNGASALEVVNTTGTLTDYRGGLTFATDSGFTAEKVPTAVSAPTNIDSTYAEVTWTFAAGSFSTKPYVRGPYGFNPFNRTNNSTINGAIQTQGSMVRGVFSGEDQNVPVQPYYSTAGDYIVGS